MRVVNGSIYVGMALVSVIQVFATVGGVAQLTGSSLAAWLIAIVMGWMPLLGSASAIYGAIAAWKWPWYGAVTLFIWPSILIISRIGIAVIQSRT